MRSLAVCAGHYAGPNCFDRDTAIFLQNKLLSRKQSYAAGTLKASLANAIRAAVLFHKSGVASSPICPFCSQNTPEDTSHMYNLCPRWKDIRDKWSRRDHAMLPHCTLFTGVAVMPPSTCHLLQTGIGVDNMQHSLVQPSPSDIASETCTSYGKVVVFTDGCCLNRSSILWKRAGCGIACDSSRSHRGTVSLPLLGGQEQTAQRAELRAFLHAISQDLRHLHVFTGSACVISVWETASQPSLLDGDNLDLVSAIHFQLRSRDCLVLVPKVEAHSGCLLNDAADAAAKEGARMRYTPAFLHARKAYWQHRAAVVARQRMMLEIVLERARVANRERLLTYEFQPSTAKQSPTPCDSDSGAHRFSGYGMCEVWRA